ncbi:MAG: hypothetical protein ACRDZ8_09995 [Acidimicrobiales bacterium]
MVMACEQFQGLAPDLALGLLAGGERAAAIGHLSGCDCCRRHLDGLVKVADELLLLAPEVEPDIGFESRVIARLATAASAGPAASPEAVPTPESVRPLHRLWLRPLMVAAAVVVLLAVAATAWAGGLRLGRSQGARVSSGATTGNHQLVARTAVVWADHGRSTCQLVAFPASGSQPARLVIHLEEPAEPPDLYKVFAVPVHGPQILVGTITIADSEGTLVAAIPASAGPVNAVRVTGGTGTTRYWATFAAV